MTTKRMAPEKRQKCTAWHMQPRLESAWTSHQRAPYTGYHQGGLLIWDGTKHTIKTKICVSPSPRILSDFIEAFSKMIVQWADNAELAFIICFLGQYAKCLKNLSFVTALREPLPTEHSHTTNHSKWYPKVQLSRICFVSFSIYLDMPTSFYFM